MFGVPKRNFETFKQAQFSKFFNNEIRPKNVTPTLKYKLKQKRLPLSKLPRNEANWISIYGKDGFQCGYFCRSF